MAYRTNVENSFSQDTTQYEYNQKRADQHKAEQKAAREKRGREAKQVFHDTARRWKKIGNQYK